ncbi:MAG: hypothetical protein WA672_21685 [Candidatus Angelobacter sp.]
MPGTQRKIPSSRRRPARSGSGAPHKFNRFGYSVDGAFVQLRAMSDFANPEFHRAVLELYQALLKGFAERGVKFEEMAQYSYRFLQGDDSETVVQRGKILSAAFGTGLKAEVEAAVEAYLSDIYGLDLKSSVCHLVDDFLAYVVPRTLALPDGEEYFDRSYRHFESSIFGKSFTVTVFLVLSNIWDHSASAMLPAGFRFHWAAKDTLRDDRFSRERRVPFFEVKNTAHPIGLGRSISDQGSYFLLEYTTQLPKNKTSVEAAYHLRDDVSRKFVFASRLVTYSAVYADYRGFRMPGHLASHSFNCMNFPDEPLPHGRGSELDQSTSFWLTRILSKLMAQPFENVAVIAQKIDDALRRHRTATLDQASARLSVAVDQLLDYFQILESVVPAEGSQYIALYAARLLRAAGHSAAPGKALETFNFFKDMHKIRNDVVHGRINQVLGGKSGKNLNIDAFRHAIHTLAALYVMNGPLRDQATQLLLGEPVKLNHMYTDDHTEFTRESRASWERKKTEFFW